MTFNIGRFYMRIGNNKIDKIFGFQVPLIRVMWFDFRKQARLGLQLLFEVGYTQVWLTTVLRW